MTTLFATVLSGGRLDEAVGKGDGLGFMSLTRQAFAGAKWTTLSTAGLTAFQLVQYFVLARLLPPSDFGLIGIVTTVTGLAQVFADAGVSNAIIHRQKSTKEELSSVFWLNVIVGSIVFVLVLVSAPLIALIFNEQRILGLMTVAAVNFLITPFGQQFQVHLQKDLRFSDLAKVDLISYSLSVMVAISLATAGFGAYSFIFGSLALSALRSGLLLLLGWREWHPSFRLRRSEIEPFVRFGFFQMGSRIVNYVNSRLDQLVIGGVVGTEALGYYNLAYTLAIMPMFRINPIVTRVVFPVFAKVQSDRRRLCKGYISTLRILTTVNFPMLFGLVAVAPTLIPTIFGPNWDPAVRLVRILAVVAALRSISNPVGALVMATGRPDLGLKQDLLIMVTQLPGLWLGAWLGEDLGVAGALLLLQVLYSVYTYVILVRGTVGPCLPQYLGALLPALIATIPMAVAVTVVDYFLGGPGAGIAQLAAEITLGIVLFVCLSLLTMRHQVLEWWDLLKGSLGR